MEIKSYREEEALPCKFRPVIDESIRIAKEKGMMVRRYVLPKPDYDAVLPLFERESSRLVGHLVGHPRAQNFSDIHVLLCGKDTPLQNGRDMSSQDSPFSNDISGTTVSGELVALYLKKEASQQAIKKIFFSTFPHEFYHAIRMKSKAFAIPRSIGSTMIEEGLAQVFQLQQMACEGAAWAEGGVTEQLSKLNNQWIANARCLWPRIDETDFDYKKTVFGDFPFYPFSLALAAASLEKMGRSVLDPEILYAPYGKILDHWRPERGGKLDFEKDLPKFVKKVLAQPSFLISQL